MLKNILLIGPFTDIGGVQVHLNRLVELLKEYYRFTIIDESRNIDSNILSIRKINISVIKNYLYYIRSADVVHIHTGVWWLRIIHILIAKLFRKKIIVTLHSLNSENGNILKEKCTSLFIKLSDKLIVVNKKIAEVLNIKRYDIKHAFIPPKLKNELEIPKKYEKYFKDNCFIILANAYRLKILNGIDLYGLDLCIEVSKKIKLNNINAIIIFIIADLENSNKIIFNKYKMLINQNELENNIKIIPEKISFVNAIMKSDLIIRPTFVDSASLTIREALYLGKPVVGSNATKRPKGAIIFKNRDFNDLYEKIIYVKNNYDDIKNNISTYSEELFDDIYYKKMYLI